MGRLPGWGRVMAFMLSWPFRMKMGFIWSFWLRPRLEGFYPKNRVWKIERTWAVSCCTRIEQYTNEHPLVNATYLKLLAIHFLTSGSNF